MLKVRKEGVIIEGKFDDKDIYRQIVKESSFSTLIINLPIKDFDARCIRITSDLADEGLMYGTDYVIARANNDS